MPSVQDYYCPPDLYDVIYSDIRDDIPFWVAAAKRAEGPVLELGCGTGRVLIPCLEAGVPVEGLDASRAMLDHGRAKLAALGLDATLTVGDMRDFAPRSRPALIMIPFSAFLHNMTQADQLATLACCRAALGPGGRLMLCIFQPDVTLLAQNDGTPRLLKTFPGPGGGSVRVIDAGRCDTVEQHIWIERRVEVLDEAGNVTASHDLPFELRYLWKPEMELLLARAGFARCAVEAHTGYTKGFTAKPALEQGDQAVWTAWRD